MAAHLCRRAAETPDGARTQRRQNTGPSVASQLVAFGPGDPLSMPQTLVLAWSLSGCGHLLRLGTGKLASL